MQHGCHCCRRGSHACKNITVTGDALRVTYDSTFTLTDTCSSFLACDSTSVASLAFSALSQALRQRCYSNIASFESPFHALTSLFVSFLFSDITILAFASNHTFVCTAPPIKPPCRRPSSPGANAGRGLGMLTPAAAFSLCNC